MEAAMNNLRKLDADTESLLGIVAPFVPMLTLFPRWQDDGVQARWGVNYFGDCKYICLLGIGLVLASMAISKKRVRIKVLLSFLGHALFWIPIYYMNHLEAAIGISVSTIWPYIALIAAVGLFVFQSLLYIDMYHRSKE